MTGSRPASGLPFTERVLTALPGSSVLWAVAWSAIVLARPFVAGAILLASGSPSEAGDVIATHLPHNLALALIVVIALRGTHLLARDATRALRAVDRSPHGIDNIVGPALIAAVLVVVEGASPMVPTSLGASVADLVLLAGPAVPIATWIWTFAAVLVSIDRLGSRELPVEAIPLDRGLGLLQVGSVPFNGFWLFAIAAVVNFAVVAHDLVGYVVGLALFLLVLVAIIVSFWRLHVQMVSAKARFAAEALRLLTQAYEPYARDPTLATLEAQARRIAAAEAFEKRARDIHEWPIDDRIVTRTVLIATAVFAGVATRIIATQLGT